MWLEMLFQGFMDTAKSGQVSMPIRILCTILVSLVFLVAIAGLFLLAFVIDDQSLLKKGAFLILWLMILAYYLKFAKSIVRRRKSVRSDPTKEQV